MLQLIKTIKKRDPAIHSWLETLLYPGLWAIVFHRPAHLLYRCKLFFIARLISQCTRFFTGIEIHPGAQIGNAVFIDHGMGVVIGETCKIGNHVQMYHGVTLGATSSEKIQRHPIIGNHVIIGANATILGAITIGNHAKIGAHALVIKNVPDNGLVLAEPSHYKIES
ncbi:MAG: serine O-acetyltransferase [Defluviitaleaceae bacterium]|nr:serine O-acetyltransferase [Defluviitaleaceae bacterium]